MNSYSNTSNRVDHNAKPYIAFLLGLTAIVTSSILLGCAPQPKSLFEQQAEAQAASEIGADTKIGKPTSSDSIIVVPNETNSKQAIAIDISKQQAIARQPNCDPQQASCQYLELNVLAFTPTQPWLENIMWQTVARVLSPDTPFTSQQQVAKDSILTLLKQIEFNTGGVTSQPSYQRIDTELTLNESIDTTNHTSKSNNTDDDKNNNSSQVVSGYLLVESTQHRGSSHKQWQLNYIMLDMQKKIQLTISDILLPKVDTDKLLLAFQPVKKQWLAEQGIEPQYLEEWPLPLSKQWYLDQHGLHMVYQSGELLNDKLNAVDLVVPYSQLQGIVKPSYRVRSSVKSSIETLSN